MADHTVDELFERFLAERAAGSRPDPLAYLADAGDGADELAGLIEWAVAALPPAPASDDDRAAVSALLAGSPEEGLLERRRRLGLKRERVVEHLIRTLGLRPELKARAAAAYHELESGLLDIAGVSDRVWRVLGLLLGAEPDALKAVPPPLQMQAAPAFRDARITEFNLTIAEPEQPDEIDALFRGRG